MGQIQHLWSRLAVGSALIVSQILGASHAAADERSSADLARLIAKEPFGRAWPLPEEFSADRLQRLLQLFADQTLGTAFRVIGDENDFFHGHILWTADELTTEGRMKPVAILYHTQEEAYSAHWRTNRSTRNEPAAVEFDYLDVRTRNWLQWLSSDPAQDGVRIENARDYVLAAKKNPEIFYGENIPVEREHFTIHGRWLDPEKLGVGLIGEMQWEFYKAECGSEKTPLAAFERGPVALAMSGNHKECLMLHAKSVFFSH